MLAVTEANSAGYDEAILLTRRGLRRRRLGREHLRRQGRRDLHAADLSTSILPGITRDTVIEIAQELGYMVVEKNLIRTDLYLADEVFMCGTAAEVTPLRVGRRPRDRRRARDDGDPAGVPRHGAREIERRHHWLDYLPAPAPRRG